MADIAAQPFINYGLSQAQQGQAASSANLQGQQAQAAAMTNQITAARMPFIMKMYEQMSATSDTSGVDGHGQSGGPLAARDQSVADNGFDADQITQRNNQKYVVPEWHGDEKQFSQNAPLMGDEVVKVAAMRRQQRLDMGRQKSAYDSSTEYSKYAAAALAHDAGSSSYSALQQADPQYIKWLDKHVQQQHDQGNDIDKEAAAYGYAKYQAADLHKFTGRKVKQVDGHNIDEDNGLPVAGVPDIGLSPAKQAEIMMAAQTPSVKISTGRPGQEKSIAPWQAAGYPNVHDYLAAVEQGIAPSPQQISTMTAGQPMTANAIANMRSDFKHRAIANASAGNAPAPYKPTEHPAPDPQNPGASVPMPKHPKPQAQPNAQAPPPAAAGAQPAPAAGAPGAAPAAQPAPAPAATAHPAPFKGTEMLDGVDPNTLPKYTPPTNPPGVSASTEQQNDITAHNKAKYEELNNSNHALASSATERGLLGQAQNEIDKMKDNPRMVGPGSMFTKRWNEFLAYKNGKAPDALVERQMLEKVLIQLGAANVAAATFAQGRVGQQEYMKLLTEGNPNAEQALETIQHLVNFSKYNNEYTTRVNNTRVAALNNKADPYSPQFATLDQGRAHYVQSRMNPAPTAQKYSPEQTSAWVQAHKAKFGGDEGKAREWLQAHQQ